jgi:protein-S-isoprenylcysteine O-methyltransferase Ste14
MNDFQHRDDPDRNRLRRPGILVVVGGFLGPLIQGICFFAAAGRFDLPRAWLFLGVTFGCMVGNVVVLALVNPAMLNYRGLSRKRKDTKAWDRKLLPVFGVFGMYILPFVMGLDVGRYSWSSLGLWAAILGVAIFSFGWILLTWAMLVNPHFEATVRIQMDRHHRVVTTGPYAIVRHPGYVGASLWALGSPLIVGSAYGLIPAGITVGLLVLRTWLEDKTLQAELPGYTEYTKQVRYRLLPGIW